MAAPSLSRVDLKINRAKKQLALIDAARTRYLAETSHAVEEDPDTGDYVFRVSQPPLIDLGLIVSEYAHMLRSSLDNMLWQLVEPRGRRPGDHIQFPIKEQRPQPQGQSQRKGRKSKDPWSGIDGIDAPDRTFIQDAQPYHLGTDPQGNSMARFHPLAMLGFLNNYDKHRYLHPVAGGAAGGAGPLPNTLGSVPYFFSEPARITAMTLGVITQNGPRLPDGRVLQVPLNQFRGGPYWPAITVDGRLATGPEADVPNCTISYDRNDESAEIFRLIGVGRSGAEVDMDHTTAIEISFSGKERPISLYDLGKIGERVAEIVDHFRPEFV